MQILPAIDLREGRVVRLAQGDYERQTVYGSDPLEVARRFLAAGVEWIHVVDLDAARSGVRSNAGPVGRLCRETTARIQLGGGIRDDQAVRAALELGVTRVVVGSAALKDWEWFRRLCLREDLAGRIVLALDARQGQLAVHGWTQSAGLTVLEVARRARSLPLAAIVYTDIQRDGMLSGPDVDTAGEIMSQSNLPVIVSGGIGGIDDVRRCREIGCAGVIIGRAYYEGRIDLAAACAVARE